MILLSAISRRFGHSLVYTDDQKRDTSADIDQSNLRQELEVPYLAGTRSD